jgi:hypothetical protein
VPVPPSSVSPGSRPPKTVSLPGLALIVFGPGLPVIVSSPLLPYAYSKLSASSVPGATLSPRLIVAPGEPGVPSPA